MSANATGTPTTNLSIPKFNTASDAPNGRGVNEMMDAIDTLMAARDVTLAAKLTSSNSVGFTQISSTAANQDIAWFDSHVIHGFIDFTGNGGTIRSLAAPSAQGARVIFRGSPGAVTIKHNTAGGTGVILFTQSGTDVVLHSTDTIEFVYATSGVWVEVNRQVTTYTLYTPVLTAATTNPTIGAGGTNGRYVQVGKLIHYYGRVTFGAGMAAGSGVYFVSLPAAADISIDQVPAGGTRFYHSATAGAATPGCEITSSDGGSKFRFRYTSTWPSGTLTDVTDSAPWVWAAGDELHWDIVYEAI